MTPETLPETLTDEYVRQRVEEMKWYAPIDFGNGITARPFLWPDAPVDTPHMGAGRFEFILRRNLPDLQGKRVLDLGCNAGLMAIHMARIGAREIVGVDSDATWKGWHEQALFVKQVLERRCETRYNVEYVEADLRRLSSLELGKFDVALALCCIYYLTTDEIDQLIQHVATIADTFLIQGNTVRRDHAQAPELKRRARPRFLRDALRRNGFPVVQIDAPWGYGRPVILGKKDATNSIAGDSMRMLMRRAARKVSFIPHVLARGTFRDAEPVST